MRKLFKHIVLFLFPVLLVIYCIPLNNDLKYSGLEQDCTNQGAWIYNRTQLNTNPIDIAFLGSSHTLNGINDAYISKTLNPLKVANMGYCRLGRNLHYSLLKMLLKKKKPKYIVLEILEQEDRYSHPIFPLVSETKDVLAPTLFFNRDYFSDVWVHTLYKIELIQDFFFHPPTPNTITYTHSFGPVPDTTSVAKLEEAKIKHHKTKSELSELEYGFHNRFPMEYIKQIYELCEAHDIKLSFLYIPGYGVPFNPEELNKRYSMYGNLLLPPQRIFNNTNYWADDGHLNAAGGNALSVWVAERLKPIVSP